MTKAHHKVVRDAMRIPSRAAIQITSVGSSKYQRDLSSHLTEVSGFRIEPGVRTQGPYEVKYIQAYTTDKSVLYNRDGNHHAKFLTTKEAMGRDHPAPSIVGMHNIYKGASNNNPSHARLELRVPLKFGEEVLLGVSNDFLGNLLHFSGDVWWGFRVVRLMGASHLLARQAIGRLDKRISYESITLTAACVLLVNGLHARPEDGPAARQVLECVLPRDKVVDDNELAIHPRMFAGVQRHEGVEIFEGFDSEEEEEEGDDDDDDGPADGTPFARLGCVFFRRIKLTD
ncbi:hypothetical protein H0H93_015571, partial [Arthromyces matolae]